MSEPAPHRHAAQEPHRHTAPSPLTTIRTPRFWLTPIVVLLLMLGLISVFAQGSAVAPFIYALF